MNFINNLIYIVRGEIGTFFTLGIIALSTMILNKVLENKDIEEE